MKNADREPFIGYVSIAIHDTRTFLDGLNLIPRKSDTDIVILMLLSKSIVIAEAILCLVSSGFGDEAFGLCRTAIEIELTLRYLTNKDTEARCRRFLNFYAKDKTEWSRLIKKYHPNMKPDRVNMEMYEQLAAAYKSPHRWSECADGVKGFAAEASTHETQEDGSPLTQEFYYEVLYKWMSQYAHATVSGVEQ